MARVHVRDHDQIAVTLKTGFEQMGQLAVAVLNIRLLASSVAVAVVRGQ